MRQNNPLYTTKMLKVNVANFYSPPTLVSNSSGNFTWESLSNGTCILIFV